MSSPDDIAGYQDTATGSRDAPPPEPGAAQVSAVSSPELKSLLGVVVGTLVIAALYFGKEVLVPITLAVILSFVLSPVVNFLQRLRLWRAPAVIVTVLAALALLGLIGTLIGSQAASLTADAPKYAQTIEAKVTGVQGFAVAKLASITQQLGGGHAAPAKAGTPAPSLSAPQLSTGGRRPVPVEIVQGQSSPFTIARTVLAPILSPLETTIIVLIVAIFVLMQKEDLRDRFTQEDHSADAALQSGAIACVAGRGPFDDAVSTMLAQLLDRRGASVRRIANASVSRQVISSLDLAGVTVIAVSYLELAGSPAELRYLIKRLRQRAPGAKVIVGLWPEGEAALTDAGIQQAVGADRCAGSLAVAVQAISDEALIASGTIVAAA